jgi:DNA helicase-2/ATP-dependent DNA helicase PcrA
MSLSMEQLNSAQKTAVTTTEGYVRVIAGAGSGKTRALSMRFAYLVNEIGVMPSDILCVTFTNKSAAEMRQRIRALTGDNDTGYISTFHGFCVSVLQEDIYALSYPKSFLVLDNGDIDEMLRLIYEERGLTLRHMTFSAARDMIEIRKCIKEPDYYEGLVAMPLDGLWERYQQAAKPEDIIFYGYLYQQKKCFGLDYNDLINFTLYLFRERQDLKEKWQRRLAYIMIDEFQDIDPLQYKLMEQLAGYHKNLFVVGDPDQTIYTWRGANIRYLLEFDQAFKGTKTILMMENYRSTPEILSVANSLISRNRQRMEKSLLPTLPAGEKPLYYHGDTAREEAVWISGQIKSLAAAGVPLNHIAVLYRSHFISRSLEEVFLQDKLPYVIHSGVQFFDRSEIKDALSYLRLIAYRDDLSFTRVVNTPKRNIGKRRMEFLRAYAASHGCPLYEALQGALEEDLFQNTLARRFLSLVEKYTPAGKQMPISQLLSELLDQSGYEEALRTEGSQERLDNLAELKQSVYEYETTCGEESTLESYLAHVALFTNSDAGETKNAVRLMTVHGAKGLEFPYVFLCGLEEGVFPSKKTATLEGMEEERRLAYVAVTRAMKGLYLSDSQGRNLDGSFRYPSRFLFDIEKSLLTYATDLPESLVWEAGKAIRISEQSLAAAKPAFQPGERVLHGVMGPGTVLEVDVAGAAYTIQFDDLPTPRRISFRVHLVGQD